jgi:hypothetical protein
MEAQVHGEKPFYIDVKGGEVADIGRIANTGCRHGEY